MSYLIENDHTKEECLNALDEISHRSPQMLDSCYFTCSTGKHHGVCFVEAKSESEACDMIPSPLRGNSRVTPVEKYTPEQIRSFHQG
jgi:hypothetical protein